MTFTISYTDAITGEPVSLTVNPRQQAFAVRIPEQTNEKLPELTVYVSSDQVQLHGNKRLASLDYTEIVAEAEEEDQD